MPHPYKILIIAIFSILFLGAILVALIGRSVKVTPARDYQIEVTNDSIIVYDGDRKVGTANWSEQKYSPIEDVLLMDNL